MTRAELYTHLEKIAPTAYLKFSEPRKPPFVIFAIPSGDDFMANNGHYFKVLSGWIELYMLNLDFGLMEAVEQIFILNGLPWEKENEAYIESEKVFYARWNFQLI